MFQLFYLLCFINCLVFILDLLQDFLLECVIVIILYFLHIIPQKISFEVLFAKVDFLLPLLFVGLQFAVVFELVEIVRIQVEDSAASSLE